MVNSTTGDTIHALSCIKAGAWAPERTGDASRDAWRGGEYAEELLAMIERTQNPTLFGAVVRAITEGGRYGPTEIGFCSKIGIFIQVRRNG